MPSKRLTDVIVQSPKIRSLVGVTVSLNFSGAFDSVNHVLLLDKLHHCVVTETSFKWYHSFLTNQRQYVKYTRKTDIL